MEELISFESKTQLEWIERKYAGKVRGKFFKMTWYHWGLLETPDDTIVQKTMIFGEHGQVWYYEVYASYKVSPLKTHLIIDGDMVNMKKLLGAGFSLQDKCSDVTTEGWEFIWYYRNGKVRHYYRGDIYENEYLDRLVKFAHNAAMKEWVIVKPKNVW